MEIVKGVKPPSFACLCLGPTLANPKFCFSFIIFRRNVNPVVGACDPPQATFEPCENIFRTGARQLHARTRCKTNDRHTLAAGPRPPAVQAAQSRYYLSRIVPNPITIYGRG